MKGPLVSIITPTLNPRSEHFTRCVASVRSQTYPNVQHVVVDGGSTNGFLEILRSHERLEWVSEPDSGQSSAINKGFRIARGSILGWLNADDRLTPGALEKVVETFQRDSRTGWVYGNVEILSGGSREIARPASLGKAMSWAARNPAAQPGSFHTRWALERVGYLDESFHYTMDFDLWLRLLDEGVGYSYIPETLAVFEVHDASKSGSVSHAEFLKEEARARLRSGRIRSAAVAFGRAGAWTAYERSTWNQAKFEMTIDGFAKTVGPDWRKISTELVRAGGATERALLEVKDKGRRAVPLLFLSTIWRYPETRSRIIHSLSTRMFRSWDHLTIMFKK